MIDIERMYKYMDLLEAKRFISASVFMSSMEISYATFKRDLAVLRDRFDVPIVYDRDIGAYKLDQNSDRRRLPGIWFSPEEIKVIRVMSSQLLTLEGPNFDDAYQILNSKFERIGMPEGP